MYLSCHLENNIESINGPSFTKKFQFYMFDGEVEIPVRENRPFFIWTFKDKQRSYVCQNKFVFPYNDRTMYTSYSNAHGGLQRENYIYPSTIIVTEKDRDKGFVKRYFAKSVFDTSIFEIDKSVFAMELNFYHTTSLIWYLDNLNISNYHFHWLWHIFIGYSGYELIKFSNFIS